MFSEARRDPVASIHVKDPRPPVVVFGVGLDEVERLHDDRAASAKTTPRGGKERAVRKDQHTLCTVVVSHPFTPEEVRADPAKRQAVEEWERRNVAWLQGQFGNCLTAVVRHEDEGRWHLHAYAVPDSRDMKASAFHPGQQAKAAARSAGPRPGEDDKALNRRGDAAYREAMSRWQDGYFQPVAAPCGLTRLGPGRRRLRRDEWHAERKQAEALKATMERARAVQVQGREFVQAAKASASAETAKAVQAKAAADRASVQARREREMAEKASAEAATARQAAEMAQQSAEQAKGLGGRLRSFFDGFRISKIREAVASEFRERVDQAQRLLDQARGDVRAEKERRREAERRAEASSATVREIAAQRNHAWQEVQQLRLALDWYEPQSAPNEGVQAEMMKPKERPRHCGHKVMMRVRRARHARREMSAQGAAAQLLAIFAALVSSMPLVPSPSRASSGVSVSPPATPRGMMFRPPPTLDEAMRDIRSARAVTPRVRASLDALKRVRLGG
uniref:Mob protein n=1 Tax=Rhizobium meliloti TaxID=382 RepID=Q9AGT1_RHIML|nr:mob protein [Sinorhizobium meliloti]